MQVSRFNRKFSLKILILIFVCLVVSSCQGPAANKSRGLRLLSKEDLHNVHYKGHFKVGNKYKIKGKTYKPRKVQRYSKIGEASWYGSRYGFHGKSTANGDIYNKNLLTAAHKTLQLPSLVRVKNLENGKSLIVLVNDRGPYSYNREIDLSERAAMILGFKHKGTAKVKVQYLHHETQKFLKILGIKPREGSTSKLPLANKECSVNCHIKLINLKYRHKYSL